MCDGAEVPRVVRAAGVMINGDSASVPSERVSGVQLITCGRGVKNTVSVTSDDGETLTLALNRAVETLSGVCEPMELPVRRRGRSDFMCMAEFAAAILLERNRAVIQYGCGYSAPCVLFAFPELVKLPAYSEQT